MTSVVSDVVWRNVGKGLIFVLSFIRNKLISHFTLFFSVETRAQKNELRRDSELLDFCLFAFEI